MVPTNESVIAMIFNIFGFDFSRLMSNIGPPIYYAIFRITRKSPKNFQHKSISQEFEAFHIFRGQFRPFWMISRFGEVYERQTVNSALHASFNLMMFGHLVHTPLSRHLFSATSYVLIYISSPDILSIINFLCPKFFSKIKKGSKFSAKNSF